MPRELRKRTSRPNYAALANPEEYEGAGSSNVVQRSEEEYGAGGSDFAPEEDAQGDDDDELPEDLEDEAFAGSPSDEEEAGTSRNPNKRNTTKKRTKQAATTTSTVLPSGHHRHRPTPIFQWEGKIERLKERPELFKEPVIGSTNSWSYNHSAHSRIARAHGFNVGSGPLWELLEDRGWYKECFKHLGDESEAYRRPRVHEDVKILDGWEILSREDAAVYLPVNSETDSSSSSVSCSFGRVHEQTRVNINTFDSVKISTHIPGSKSHVFNAGAGVWGLDWCPIHPDERTARAYKQYLAVAPLPSKAHVSKLGARLQRPSYACIQIWTLSQSEDGNGETEKEGNMRCEMVICIESGAAHELKWCPLPSHDQSQKSGATPRKLGIIAGTFEDGSVSMYAIPDPADLRSRTGKSDESDPIIVRMSKPLLRLELEDTTLWCLDWANSDILAVGCSNGYLVVYDVGTALHEGNSGLEENILPTHYFSVHQSAVQSITWVRVPTISGRGEVTADNPTIIASGGFDGQECFSDIRECTGIVINRTRDVVNSMNYSAFYGGPILVDQENSVKAYSLSPIMLGRGHKFLEPAGPVWSIHSSDYHPQLAVGVSDGSCLTTNTLRSTRRGGVVGFFVHKIFQLDYSRKTGEYRMLERFLPQETQDRPTATKANKVLPIGTGAWSPEVGVHRVVWNAGNGLGGAPLLASATGSGLCRVDWLLGRWYRDRIPYMNIETIRQEVEDDDIMEEDSD